MSAEFKVLFYYQGRIVGTISYVSDSRGKDFCMKIDILDELLQKFNEKYN